MTDETPQPKLEVRVTGAVRGDVFLIVRVRDVHAVASTERAAGSTGLYL